MSVVPRHIKEKKAKNFDSILERAHKTRVYVENPSITTIGASKFRRRKEVGLTLIADSYREQVRNIRRMQRET